MAVDTVEALSTNGRNYAVKTSLMLRNNCATNQTLKIKSKLIQCLQYVWISICLTVCLHYTSTIINDYIVTIHVNEADGSGVYFTVPVHHR